MPIRSIPLLATLIVSALYAVASHAEGSQNFGQKVGLTFGAGQFFYQNPDQDLSNPMLRLGMEFVFSPKWSITGALGATQGGLPEDQDARLATIALARHYRIRNDISWFLQAGGGRQRFLNDTEKSDLRGLIGAGLRIDLTSNLALKPEYLYLADSDQGSHLLILELAARFGRRRYAETIEYDSDGDGVPDHLDQCPGTPAGTVVDEHGCPLELDTPTAEPEPVVIPDLLAAEDVRRILASLETKETIHFELEKFQLTLNAQTLLRDFKNRVTGKPIRALVHGHTDSTGNNAYNLKLSEMRAKTTSNWLSRNGIENRIMTQKGFGEEQPRYSNQTRRDRMRNRRVELLLEHTAEVDPDYQPRFYADINALQTLYFPPGVSYLTPNAERIAEKLVAYLATQQSIQAQLFGHADESGPTDEANNLLSLERAQNLRNFLIAAGIPSSRISAKGLGVKYSSVRNRSKDLGALARNRRVFVQFVDPNQESNR